jgi:hypothetical protein
VIGGGSGLFASFSDLASLGSNSGGSLGLSVGLLFGNDLGLFGGEWVKSVHDSFVLEWVLLGLIVSSNS